MTRERYIVRNCPSAKYRMGMPWKILCEKESNCVKSIYCADCTDCVIKQVIEKCKETLNLMESASGRNAYAGGRCTEAGQILQLFDIEEVNK